MNYNHRPLLPDFNLTGKKQLEAAASMTSWYDKNDIAAINTDAVLN